MVNAVFNMMTDAQIEAASRIAERAWSGVPCPRETRRLSALGRQAYNAAVTDMMLAGSLQAYQGYPLEVDLYEARERMRKGMERER